MFSQRWASRAAIFTTIGILIPLTLPTFTSKKAFAQTLAVQSQCSDVDIQKYIKQLDKAEPAAFNALVGCNSQAVPALIKALKNQDENAKIITVAVLGEIGKNAAPAIPRLNKLLNNKNQDINIIAAHALGKIGEAAIPALIKALKDNKNWQVRYIAAGVLGEMGATGQEVVPVLIKASETDKNRDVRTKAADAVKQIRIPRLYQALSRRNQKIIRLLPPAQESRNPRCYRINSQRICDKSSSLSVGRAITNEIKDPPIMCKIPVLKAIFKWKCPSKDK